MTDFKILSPADRAVKL